MQHRVYLHTPRQPAPRSAQQRISYGTCSHEVSPADARAGEPLAQSAVFRITSTRHEKFASAHPPVCGCAGVRAGVFVISETAKRT
jgi:hypothetical protein